MTHIDSSGDERPATEKPYLDADLIKFAAEFARDYKILSAGSYQSECGTYRLEYGVEGFTGPARVSIKTKLVEIKRDALIANAAITTDFVFSLVLWCTIRVTYEPGMIGDMDCDAEVCREYLLVGRSRKLVFNGWINTIGKSPGGEQYKDKRIKNIYKLLIA